MDPNYNQQNHPGYPQQGYTQAPAQMPLSPEQQRLQAQAWETARTMHEGGVHPSTIYDIIVQKGVEPGAAQRIVQSATLVTAKSAKSEAGRDMLIGGAWIAGGLIITVGTYMAVSESGGHYFITYGPIIYGVIRFFKGVAKL